MPKYSTLTHPMLPLVAFRPEAPAERINDHILMSRCTSNAYVVTSDAGDVVINTGTAQQGARNRERFEQLLGRKLDVKKLIFTQSHPDHIGGWEVFNEPGTEMIAQREFPHICAERKLFGPFFGARNQRVLSALMPPPSPGAPPPTHNWFDTPDPVNPTLFADTHHFTSGGRPYTLFSTPSGETLDSLVVWMPDEKTLFTGNFMGAIYGALPNFYTARGDRDRSVARFLRDISLVIDLRPELLITGHGEPIRGNAQIHADLTKLRDAVRYIHDETVKGMNAQETLGTLMQRIQLPAHLTMAPGRGPVSWYVRAVWEEYAGWFRHENTTELYGTPASSVWGELAQMAGGAALLAEHAQAHIAKGEPVQALHLIEIALAAEPKSKPALQAEIAALETLIEQHIGNNFDEIGWIEGRITRAKEALV